MSRRTSLRRGGIPGKLVHTAPLGSIGSFLFLSNLITGPGMLALPAAYQEGGWLLGVILTVVFTLLSGLCAGYLVYAWRSHQEEKAIEDAAHAKERGEEEPEGNASNLEFETLVRATNSHSSWVTFEIVYLLSMCVMTMSCICVVARELDNLSIITLGNAYGLQVFPTFGVVPSCRAGEDCRAREAFQDTDEVHGYVVSQGYIAALIITVPFSLLEIVDWFQGLMYGISLFCLLDLIFAFSYIALNPTELKDYPHQTVSAFNYNVGLMVEVCFWSWAISFGVPMWLTQKEEGVSASRPLWWACVHRGLLDIMLGLSGAFAFPGLSSLNVLDELRLRPDVTLFTQVCGIMFAVASLLPNLVDYTMAASRNLENHVGLLRANALGVGLPYMLAWVFYFGSTFNILVNCTSTFLGGTIQFLVPTLLFIFYLDRSGHSGARVAGIRMDSETWRKASWIVAGLVTTFIVAVYLLNTMLRLGIYGPLRAIKHPQHVDTEDYESYAAYDDASPPPAPGNSTDVLFANLTLFANATDAYI